MAENKITDIRTKIITFIFFAFFAIYIFFQDVRDSVKVGYYYINESSPGYVLLGFSSLNALYALLTWKRDERRFLRVLSYSAIWGSIFTYLFVQRVNGGVRSYIHSVSELSPILYPFTVVALTSLLAWRLYKKMEKIENPNEKTASFILMSACLLAAGIFSIGLIQGVYHAF